MNLTPFFTARKAKSDWELLEDEFPALMGIIQPYELRMPVASSLEDSRNKLDALVTQSIKARSDDIF